MPYPEEDVDVFAKLLCVCGHPRYRHSGELGHGPCKETRLDRVAPNGLPEPVYDNPDDPFAMPSNWPPVSEWPQVTVPCCKGFYDAGLAAAESRDS